MTRKGESKYSDIPKKCTDAEIEQLRQSAEMISRMDTNARKYKKIIRLLREAAELVNKAGIIARERNLKGIRQVYLLYDSTIDAIKNILYLEEKKG